MKWQEFKSLIAGLGPDTPLGRVVSIRAEDDADVIKKFTKEQHRIRNEWREKSANSMTQQQYDAEMSNLEAVFASICS